MLCLHGLTVRTGQYARVNMTLHATDSRKQWKRRQNTVMGEKEENGSRYEPNEGRERNSKL